MSTARRITLSLGALVLLVGATVLPITLANAAPTKIYDLTMSPATLSAGTSGQTLTATFKNSTPSGNSSINSLKLFANAPSGFVITAATGIGDEVVQPGGQSVFVSNIPPVKNGRTYVLTMTVTTPAATDCNGSTVTWKAEQSGGSTVWTGSSFSGDTFAPNNVTANTTTLNASCGLSFTTQPSDALKGAAISPAITVTGTPASIFNGQNVTLAIANDSPTTATLGGATTVAAASSGDAVATFSDITLPKSGDYKLVATSIGSTSTGSSDTFTISDGNIDCGQTVSTNNGGDTSQTVDVTQLDVPGCSFKPYTLTHNGTSVQFLYPTGGTLSSFTIKVFSFAPEPVPSGSIPMTKIDVDASGTLATPRAIKWCNTNASGPVLPTGEVTCLVSQSVKTLATNQIQVDETYYLVGDILYKR